MNALYFIMTCYSTDIYPIAYSIKQIKRKETYDISLSPDRGKEIFFSVYAYIIAISCVKNMQVL